MADGGQAPLMIDLFCGLGGLAEGGIAEGYDVVGFDIERHAYGEHRYPAQMVIQDVLTLHGSQFRDAALIVASPPCQEFSYMAMPWSLAKAKAAAIRADESGQMRADLTRLFDACFRIQREACEAAGRHVPLVVENVKGAQPWVGRSRWMFGSFALWGDVPALMPMTLGRQAMKVGVAHRPDGATNFHGYGTPGYKAVAFNGNAAHRLRGGVKGVPHRTSGHWTNPAEHEGMKNDGGSWFAIGPRGEAAPQNNARDRLADGVKMGGSWWHDTSNNIVRRCGSKSSARKAASALIAKIPLPLSRHIAATYHPERSHAR